VQDIQVLENHRPHLTDFVRLIEEWISHYFSLEDSDRQLAAHPEQIIDDGGYIFSLFLDNTVVGVSALFQESANCYELARMAVAPAHQGKGLGHKLMRACITKAQTLDAEKLFLVSNTRLNTAINLYKRYGFESVYEGPQTGYSRGNIRMELILNQKK